MPLPGDVGDGRLLAVADPRDLRRRERDVGQHGDGDLRFGVSRRRARGSRSRKAVRTGASHRSALMPLAPSALRRPPRLRVSGTTPSLLPAVVLRASRRPGLAERSTQTLSTWPSTSRMTNSRNAASPLPDDSVASARSYPTPVATRSIRRPSRAASSSSMRPTKAADMKLATSMPSTSAGFCDEARTQVFHLRESRPSRVKSARPADQSPRKWVSSRATSLRLCMSRP